MAFASPATLKKSAILLSASKLNPQFEKRYRNGEDALVVSEDGKFVAVMDGVGGWIGRLVDTGKLTREFAGLLKKQQAEATYGSLDQLFWSAISKVNERGSTTCVMAEIDQEVHLDQEGHAFAKLNTLNLGDSGYAIFRAKDPTN